MIANNFLKLLNINNSRTISYILIKKVMWLASGVPRRLMRAFAFPLAAVWYLFDHYHRKIAIDNVMKAYGDRLSRRECRKLVRANFFHLMTVALELPSLLRLRKDNVDSYVEISGEQHLRSALSRGRGVLFLTAHLGNWELMALAPGLKYDFSVYVMVRPLDYAPMDNVLTEIRSRTGNIVLDKDKSAGAVRELLKQNQIIGILMDQNSSWYEGVYVPFFGRVACTNKGPAMFALRYGATVVPAFNFRLKNGKYRITFCPPVDPIRTGNVSRDIVETTALFNRIIEAHIKMAPDNWLWIHRRWRIKDIPQSARKKIKGNMLSGLSL
ncbi:MAG: lysophospholipid acyltransferase family protein [Deltaproteobacteria bacterium]|nr:lysophospholipid acyltransferase family protein [Deltaproteobacteria bacterium]